MGAYACWGSLREKLVTRKTLRLKTVTINGWWQGIDLLLKQCGVKQWGVNSWAEVLAGVEPAPSALLRKAA